MIQSTKPLLLILMGVLCFDCCCAEKHTGDSLATVKKALAADKAILIDVREQAEWDAGHLKQAKHLALSKLKAGTDSKALIKEIQKMIAKDMIVYIHCRSGRRVQAAAPILKGMGYDVRALKEGYEKLLKADFKKAE